MLSQRIKQQYKQSTSRLVSSLRPSSGHLSNNLFGLSQLGILSSGLNQLNQSSNPYITSSSTPSVLAGSFPQHAGHWQLVHRITGHNDGIWEVTPYKQFLATASADNTVRLWINDANLK